MRACEFVRWKNETVRLLNCFEDGETPFFFNHTFFSFICHLFIICSIILIKSWHPVWSIWLTNPNSDLCGRMRRHETNSICPSRFSCFSTIWGLTATLLLAFLSPTHVLIPAGTDLMSLTGELAQIMSTVKYSPHRRGWKRTLIYIFFGQISRNFIKSCDTFLMEPWLLAAGDPSVNIAASGTAPL